MSDELFPIEAVSQDSPKVAWMRKHGVKTHYSPHCESDDDGGPWAAWERSNYPNGDADGIPRDPELCGYGMTEDEAIRNMAAINRIPLWNEEDFLKSKWMKRYAVQIKDDAGARNGGFLAFSLSNPTWKTGYGIEQDDALVDFAIKNNLEGWKL